MRMNFAFGFFLVCLLFSHTTAPAAQNDFKPDTVSGGRKNTLQKFESSFHLSFTYGRAVFSTRNGVVNAFTESGYPYHVISRADPGAKAGQPIVLSVTLEKNIHKQLFVGIQYSNILNQKIRGSNWVGAIQADEPTPIEQFDVIESYSSKFVNGTINYIVSPVNFANSRWELTLGAGLSYNKLNLSGNQFYERHPNPYTAFDDTTASYSVSKNGLGFLFSGCMDFYWSRHISNQFKLEYRITPALKIPSQTYTYVTTRSRIRMTDTHTLKKHAIRYSGVIMSLSFRFHI